MLHAVQAFLPHLSLGGIRYSVKRIHASIPLNVLLLAVLSLQGCTVTADALHCHAEMARRILDRGAAYALALKENQSALLADARALLDAAAAQPRRPLAGLRAPRWC